MCIETTLHEKAWEYYTHNDSMRILKEKLAGAVEVDEEHDARQRVAQQMRRAAKFLEEAGPLTKELAAATSSYFRLRDEFQEANRLWSLTKLAIFNKKQHILQLKAHNDYLAADSEHRAAVSTSTMSSSTVSTVPL
jgi:hypothetical protein